MEKRTFTKEDKLAIIKEVSEQVNVADFFEQIKSIVFNFNQSKNHEEVKI
jgi:hypothetical protein